MAQPESRGHTRHIARARSLAHTRAHGTATASPPLGRPQGRVPAAESRVQTLGLGWRLPRLTFRSQILICESMVPVPKMSPSGWNCAQVRAAGEGHRAVVRAHGGDHTAEGPLASHCSPCPAQCLAPAAAAGKRILRTTEQVTKRNINTNGKRQRERQSPAPLRQLTASGGLVCHLGEHAPCLNVREGPVLKTQRQGSQ